MWCIAKTTVIHGVDMLPAGSRVEMPDDARPNPLAWDIEKPAADADDDSGIKTAHPDASQTKITQTRAPKKKARK